MRETQSKTAHLTSTEGVHWLIRNAAHLFQQPIRNILGLTKGLLTPLTFNTIQQKKSNLSGYAAPLNDLWFALQYLCAGFIGHLRIELTVGGAASLLLESHHGADTGVHLCNKQSKSNFNKHQILVFSLWFLNSKSDPTCSGGLRPFTVM